MSLHSSTTFLAKAPTSVPGERLFTRILGKKKKKKKVQDALRCISPYRGKLTGYRLHFIPVVNSHFQMWSRNSNENGQINIFRQPFVSAHVQGADIISQQREYREKDFNNGGQQCEEPGISSFAITYSYFLVKANDVMVSEDREVYILHYECEVS